MITLIFSTLGALITGFIGGYKVATLIQARKDLTLQQRLVKASENLEKAKEKVRSEKALKDANTVYGKFNHFKVRSPSRLP